MTKLEFPKLTELTPTAINNWLGRCEDTYKAWQVLNTEKSLDPKLLITLAGLRMEESTAASWWNKNRSTLKACTSWEAFGTRVRERFVPVNWKLTALTAFYAVYQGSAPFPSFITQLQDTRNALASAGDGYVINDAIMKNHLLFHCHPLLRLRVCGQPGFAYEKLKLDGLISTMTAAWESLVAERVVKVSAGAPSSSVPSSSTSTPSSSSSASSTPFVHSLSPVEKETLKAAGGCYHCKKTPQSEGWVKHRSENCPGDAAAGIPPRAATSVIAAVGAPGFSKEYEERPSRTCPIAVVMPPVVFDEDDSSDSSSLSQYIPWSC
ncbi:hypothetical protein MSAN_01746100 [Mycena sanguinolenta]|uniref:Uncharacterized protein n=1 Tax=Mycena sanguinolenta TaxID=230812 RepID=A0A8H7CVI8_9AGAR|nr:hypothetical protein MSAN_01746100 [Mycena sanguinolenta]